MNIDQYVAEVDECLTGLPSRDRERAVQSLTSLLRELHDAGGSGVAELMAELGSPEQAAGVIRRELSNPAQTPKLLLGKVPYNFEVPQGTRIGSLWDPSEDAVAPAKAWGVGSGLNLGALAVRLHLIDRDYDDTRVWDATTPAARGFLPALAVAAFLAAGLILLLTPMPERVPIHWGPGGIDNYASPAFVAAVSLLITGAAAAYAVSWAIRSWRTPREIVLRSTTAGIIGWATVLVLVCALWVPALGLVVALVGIVVILAVYTVLPALVLRRAALSLAKSG